MGEHKTLDPLGRARTQPLTNHTAEREAAEVDQRDSEHVEEFHNVSTKSI
ncbi:hypothetical protein CP98_05252 [Sphingobium yanoikuyae]|uniref:Uncharacterized protein n=1 Tax=Sphingobium yanoikuyae TaxID=13690 RepID=A0A084E233_SPHYA|nr:hypothetical protein CP98_05252 [Sphingobium yanoikuyae]